MGSTAGNSQSWAILGGLLLVAALQPVGCNTTDGTDGTDAGTAGIEDALAQADVVVVDLLAAYQTELTELDGAVQAWHDGAGSREEAQSAWIDAMAAWQQIEAAQIGPIASSLNAVGGADLRDETYSWPDVVNPCRVDQETVEAVWDQPEFFTANLVSSYGFDALEHLLFANEDLTCPSQVGIDGDWSALGPTGVDANRAAYAVATVGGLQDTLDTMNADWADFAPGLVDGSAYPSQLDALNAVYDAIFFVETRTKDRKLGVPLGLREECASDTCPDAVEAPISGTSALWVAANLRGARTVFTGGDGAGMDDLLIEVGEQALVDDMLADFDAAIATAEATESDLGAAIEADPAAVMALYDDVKLVTDHIKNDVSTLLTLQIPQEAAGDND